MKCSIWTYVSNFSAWFLHGPISLCTPGIVKYIPRCRLCKASYYTNYETLYMVWISYENLLIRFLCPNRHVDLRGGKISHRKYGNSKSTCRTEDSSMSTLKWSPSYPEGFLIPIFPNHHQRFWSRIESFFDFLYVLQLSLQKELFLAIDNFPCSIWLDDWDKLFQMIPAKIVFNVRRLDCPTGVHKAQGYLKAYKVNQFMWNLKLISNKMWINN